VWLPAAWVALVDQTVVRTFHRDADLPQRGVCGERGFELFAQRLRPGIEQRAHRRLGQILQRCLVDEAGEPRLDPLDGLALAIDPGVPLYTLEKGVFAVWEEAGVTIRDPRNPASTAVPRDRFFERLQPRVSTKSW
jgi:hypothetical protein